MTELRPGHPVHLRAAYGGVRGSRATQPGLELGSLFVSWENSDTPPSCLSFFISKSRTVLPPKEAEFKHVKCQTSPSPHPCSLATVSSFSKSASVL